MGKRPEPRAQIIAACGPDGHGTRLLAAADRSIVEVHVAFR